MYRAWLSELSGNSAHLRLPTKQNIFKFKSKNERETTRKQAANGQLSRSAKLRASSCQQRSAGSAPRACNLHAKSGSSHPFASTSPGKTERSRPKWPLHRALPTCRSALATPARLCRCTPTPATLPATSCRSRFGAKRRIAGESKAAARAPRPSAPPAPPPAAAAPPARAPSPQRPPPAQKKPKCISADTTCNFLASTLAEWEADSGGRTRFRQHGHPRRHTRSTTFTLQSGFRKLRML